MWPEDAEIAVNGPAFPGRHPGLLLLIAVVAPVGVAALLALLRGHLSSADCALVLMLVIVGVATLGSRVAGLVSAVVAGAGYDFFLTAPYYRLAITARADVLTTALLFVGGVAVTELAQWGRRQVARAGQQQGYLDGVLSTAGTPDGTSVAALIGSVETQLVRLLDLDSAEFLPTTEPGYPTLHPDGSLSARVRTVNVDRSGLPTDTPLTLPVGNAGRSYGSFRLVAATHVARPAVRQRRIAALLAERVGVVLAAEPRSTPR